MYECFKGLSCVLFFRLFSLGLLPSIVSDFLPRTTGFPLAFCHGHLEFHFDYSVGKLRLQLGLIVLL